MLCVWRGAAARAGGRLTWCGGPQDVEKFRAVLDDDEYADTKATTERQLEVCHALACLGSRSWVPVVTRPCLCVQEFEESLAHMTSGNITLVDAHGVSRLAMRKAIRAAFSTPEVRKMFEQQNSRALRQRLEQLQREQMLNKIDADTYKYVAVFARVCVCVCCCVVVVAPRVRGVCVLRGRVRLSHCKLPCTRDQAVEVMVALKNLGAKVRAFVCAHHAVMLIPSCIGVVVLQLTDEEKAFLDSSRDVMAKFESADQAIGA